MFDSDGLLVVLPLSHQPPSLDNNSSCWNELYQARKYIRGLEAELQRRDKCFDDRQDNDDLPQEHATIKTSSKKVSDAIAVL